MATIPIKLDARYTFSYEYTGREKPQHVVRFCNSWVGSAPTLAEAEDIARNYENNRWPQPEQVSENPIVAETTENGQTDGCRTFRLQSGHLALYNPLYVTVESFQKTYGVPMPPFPPSPTLNPEAADTPPASTTEPRITLDGKARRYVVKDKAGFTVHTYDAIARRTEALAKALNMPILTPFEPGTLEAYRRYLAIMATAKAQFEATGKPFTFELTPQLTGLEGRLVEVRNNHGDTPRRFTVGATEGWIPCHLELPLPCHRPLTPARMEYATVNIIQ